MTSNLWKRVWALAVASLLLISSVACSSGDKQKPQTSTDTVSGQKITGAACYAYGTRYELWADGDTSEVWITDRAGNVLWSTFATLAEGMYDMATEERRNAVLLVYSVDTYNNSNMASSYTASVQQKGLTMEAVDNGVILYFDFPGELERYTIPVQFTLVKDRLNVEILFDRIRTYGEVTVTTIDLMPYFGAGTATDEGYLLVPDGSGALIEFGKTNRDAEVYSQPVYGKDPVLTNFRQMEQLQEARLPVFGLNKNGQGFVAYARQGACEATVNAGQPGKISIYSHLHFSFTYTQRDSYTLDDKDFNAQTVYVNAEKSSTVNPVVTYLFLEDRTDYVGMANTLRDYLVETEGYMRTTAVDPRLYLEMFGGATQKKNLLGISYNTLQVATTLSDVQDIVTALRDKVNVDMSVMLYGFQKNGMYNNAYNWSFDSAFGGTKAFEALCSYAASNHITIFPALDFQSLYKGNRSNIARRISGDYVTEGLRKIHTGEVDETKLWYLQSPSHTALLAKKFLESQTIPAGTGVFLPAYGRSVYADYQKDKTLVRSEALAFVKQTLEVANNQAAVNGGNLYAVSQSSAVLQAPLSSSGFLVETAEVPFYTILLHGLNSFAGSPINEADNPTEHFLRCIADGYALNFRLTEKSSHTLKKTDLNYLLSTEFSAWEEEIVSMVSRLDELNGTNDRFITDYYQEGDVTVTTYDNGTKVYVNFGTVEAVINGQTVPAQDFVCAH